jgi:acyl-CoA thioesterase FadM
VKLIKKQNHVNNVTYVRWAEGARVNWARNYAIHHDPVHRKEWNELCTPRGIGMILKTMTTDYKFVYPPSPPPTTTFTYTPLLQPMTYPDHITVLHKLHSLPSPTSSHFTLDVLILSELHQRIAARCTEEIVVYDYKANRKADVKPFMMDAFRHLWNLQEREQRQAETVIREVEARVRDLEVQTWDREGAVEDLGGAGR